VDQIRKGNLQLMIELNVCRATGANAKGSTLINLTIVIVMISHRNDCDSSFTFFGTGLLVATRINRQRKYVHGEKKAHQSHGTKVNEKGMQ